MTDTITTVTVPQRIVDSGYHAPLDLLRSVAADMRKHGRMSELTDPFTSWYGGGHTLPGRNLVAFRDTAIPLERVPVDELRYLGGFLHWLITVEVDLDVSMRITVGITMTRREYAGDWDINDYQDDIDEEIRSFTHRKNADFEIVDHRGA